MSAASAASADVVVDDLGDGLAERYRATRGLEAHQARFSGLLNGEYAVEEVGMANLERNKKCKVVIPIQWEDEIWRMALVGLIPSGRANVHITLDCAAPMAPTYAVEALVSVSVSHGVSLAGLDIIATDPHSVRKMVSIKGTLEFNVSSVDLDADDFDDQEFFV